MILYQHPLSPFAQKLRIALREKSLAFETVRLQGRDGSAATVNPRVELPALEHEGAVIFDSTVILEYLEDRFPDPPLRPASPLERARARMIEEVCDTHYEAINWGLGELRFFKRAPGELGQTLLARAREQTADLHKWLGGQISAQGWLNGPAFGWADLAAAPFVTMSEMFGVPPEPGSPLAGWLTRVMERPSVAITVAEALATVPELDQVAAAIAGSGFRRQFRDHRLEWMIRSGGLQVVLDGLAADNIRFTETAPFARAASEAK